MADTWLANYAAACKGRRSGLAPLESVYRDCQGSLRVVKVDSL